MGQHNIQIPDFVEEWISDIIASGEYGDSMEGVLAAAVRSLRDEDTPRRDAEIAKRFDGIDDLSTLSPPADLEEDDRIDWLMDLDDERIKRQNDEKLKAFRLRRTEVFLNDEQNRMLNSYSVAEASSVDYSRATDIPYCDEKVSLTAEQRAFIQSLLSAGAHKSTTSAVAAALELLEAQDLEERKLAHIHALIQEGIDSLDAGEGIPWEQAKEELLHRFADREKRFAQE